MNELKELIRPNILSMKAYSSAQSESGSAISVKLNANESPYGSLNRYPDSSHDALRTKLAEIKSINKDQILITNGSDESIDLIYRMVCVPGNSIALSFKPGFGMYKTAAELNGVEFVELDLDDSYDIDKDSIKAYYLKQELKLIFICSPNNPTGNLLNRQVLIDILENFKGIVVVDEAYIDFAESESFIGLLDRFPRLIVIQTFSKSMALAGARIGMAYGHPFFISILAKMKFPYNISSLNLEAALRQVDRVDEFKVINSRILTERSKLRSELLKLACVDHIYNSDANFLLVRFQNAIEIFNYLNAKGISVRNKHKECRNCLRITIGTPEENRLLYNTLKTF